jgi:hypothetical protein
MRNVIKLITRYKNKETGEIINNHYEVTASFVSDNGNSLTIHPNETEIENNELILVMFNDLIKSHEDSYITSEEWQNFCDTEWEEETQEILVPAATIVPEGTPGY